MYSTAPANKYEDHRQRCWLVVWVLWHIKFYRLFTAKSFFYTNNQFYFNEFSQAVLIQLIQFSISTDFVYTQLNVKTV